MEFNSRKRKRKIEDETSSDNDIKMEESKSEQSRLLKEFIECCKKEESNETIELILKKYPDIINQREDETGMTGLMYSCISGNIKNIRLLLTRKANINIQDQIKNTALIHCAKTSNFEIIKMLIINGGNRYAKNGEEKSLLDLISKDIKKKVESIEKTIFESIMQLDIENVKIFFSNGFLANTTDNTGRTLLEILQDTDTRKNDTIEIRKFLLSNYGTISIK